MEKLYRRFTPITLLILSINGMVGSAWLFAPLYAAKIAGSAAVFSWLLGGLITVIIALTFAELSVLFPLPGGSAQIPAISHGTFTSFMMSWIAWLSALTMAPIEVQAILQYASTYFTSLVVMHETVPVLSWYGLFWATLLMLSFCAINIYSYKSLERSNFIIFSFKVLVIILLIIMLMKTSFHVDNFAGTHSTLFSLTGWHAILSAVATGGIAFAFTGFKHGVELAGETKQLKIAIPLAIVGSVIGCLILYLGLQIAFIGALDPIMLEKGWQHITFVGDAGPFAGLALALGIIWLAKLLYIDAAISPGGAGLIYVTSTARILYAMSEIGFMPRVFSKVNNQKFPVYAIMFNFALGMLLFLPLPGWQAMVSFLVSGMVLSYAMGPISLSCLRKSLPAQERPFKLPFAEVICPLAFYFCTLISYWTGWETISKLAIALFIGLLFFVLAKLRGTLGSKPLGLKSAYWLIPYFGGLVLLSYLGTFGGGKGIIPFGWDFFVIALFSSAIFYLAVKTRIVTDYKALDDKLAAIATI